MGIILNIYFLGTFDFEGQRLLPFVLRCANFFLIHEVTEIRLEAVRTTSRLLRHAIQSAEKSPSDTITRTVADVLQKLLGKYFMGIVFFMTENIGRASFDIDISSDIYIYTTQRSVENYTQKHHQNTETSLMIIV